MFVTVDDARMKIPFPIAAEGEHYWSSVQMHLHNAWFLVAYEIRPNDTDHRIHSTVFVATSKDVVAIGKIVNVTQTAIVTPAWMNQSDGWKMETLKEMWVGSEPDAKGGNTATVCVTVQGSKHVISAIDTPEDELTNLRRVL